MAWTTQQIAELVDGRLEGPGDLPIRSVEMLGRAGADQLSYIGDQRHARDWPASAAAAALVTRGVELSPDDGRALIFVTNVDLAVARVLEAMAPEPPRPAPGVHASATVDESARLGDGVRIGAGCYVGPHATIGDRTVLHPNVTVMDEAVIGAETVLWPGVVVRERCRLGDRCTMHPNVTIGADGFGYRPTEDGSHLVKIPQIGAVTIGHDVEIGAGSCVDRGKFSATEIGDGSKIDNLVQVAHNCRIGKAVVIAGGTAVGGSVTIGDGAMIGGGATIRDHCTIGRGAQLAGAAVLAHDVPDGQKWATGVAAKEAKAAMREFVALGKLPGLLKSLRPGRNE